ncbi:sensor histidine kinase [Wenyingzhuangia marina]|uniref:histidine kinase n=1 Tax=Wenyingzhuangia marina TaxID=1195760 RepID=A0A1M5WNB9_9FLAO|nr:hypothetical protein [Wenyingzhuangia marina]GGF79442.1 hypothetical protein GCM10011397_23110 [Wenyingzhuangia marina]SHH88902.1 hypothetical protein SAMN05444281_2519 [Wenyingzhuangia marina]
MIYNTENINKDNNYLNLDSQDYNYIFSHILRTPLYNLHALINWFEKDNEDLLDNVNRHKLKLINASIERLNFIVTDITNFLNIEQNIEKNYPISLDYIFQKIQTKLEKPLRIEIKILQKLPVIYSNSPAMEILFNHLLINSFQNIKNNSGSITIDYEEDENNYKFIYTENWNTLDNTFHDILAFKSYYVPSNNYHLSIIKKIIESLHGDIKFYKILNKGIKIDFTIPRY